MNPIKESSINKLNNFIAGWYIDADLCDRIIADYESKIDIERAAHSARGYSFILSRDMDCDVITEYDFALNNVLSEYNSLYPYSLKETSAYEVSFPFNIQKYYPGNHYSVWHCENNGKENNIYRHLAFMTYLNDVTDAGETEFYHYNLKVKPEKGLTLIWPAHFTHVHRGIPSNSQTKYIATGWYVFLQDRDVEKTVTDATDEDFHAWLEKLNNIK